MSEEEQVVLIDGVLEVLYSCIVQFYFQDEFPFRPLLKIRGLTTLYLKPTLFDKSRPCLKK